MKGLQRSLGLHLLICASLVASLVIGDMVILRPKPAVGQSFINRIRRFFSPTPGTPSGRRQGAAVRDPDLCPTLGHNEPPLTALVPLGDAPIRTTDTSPMFWFYVPYTITASDRTQFALEFVLQDETYRDVYRTAFTLPETTPPGIVGIRPRLDDAPLALNETYRWYFLIYCNDPGQIYEPAFVQGTIVRERSLMASSDESVSENVEMRLLEQAETGRWLDVLNTLNLAYPHDPTLTDAWKNLLQAIDLGPEIQAAPLSGRFYIPDAAIPNSSE